MKHCILCNSPELSIISRIQVADLMAIYTKSPGIDILEEFNGTNEIFYLKCNRCDLRFFDPPMAGSPDYYNKMSASNSSSYYIEEKSEYTFAATFIKDSDAVLDIGSGIGNFSKYVKGSFTGLDFNPFAIRIAKERNICVLGDSLDTHLVQNEGRYSVVTCFQVLEHIPTPHLFIQSCLRALRAGGVLIVSVPSEDSWVSLQENSVLNMPPHHVSHWTDACLRGLGELFQIQFVGLEHEELSKGHVNPFCLCMLKRLLREILGWKNNKLIDLSLKAKLISAIASWMVPLCARALAPSKIMPRGHSVTFVYRKLK